MHAPALGNHGRVHTSFTKSCDCQHHVMREVAGMTTFVEGTSLGVVFACALLAARVLIGLV